MPFILAAQSAAMGRRQDHFVWDVAVVGAGPAGSAAALAALTSRPHARVLLLDRASFPRDKPCGDGIAPQALSVLAALGVPDAAAGFPPVSLLHLVSPGGRHAVGRLSRAARVVPRAVFDARLVAAAVSRGATLRQAAVRSVSVRPNLVVLNGDVAARVVVAADGAHSTVRRLLGVPANPVGTVALALRGYASASATASGSASASATGSDAAGEPEQLLVMTRERWPAYAWAFPFGPAGVNVGYGELLRPGRRLDRARLHGRLADLLPAWPAEPDSLRAHHLPLSTGRPRQPDGRVLLAGDALSLINPLSGEGIYYAVRSGALAGVAAGSQAEAGAAYRQALSARLGRHLRTTDALARLVRHPALLEPAVAAASRDPRAFADLLEICLGRGWFTPRLAGAVLSAVARGGEPGGAARSGRAPGQGRRRERS